MKTKLLTGLLAVAASVIFSGCATTKITGEWKNPEVDVSAPYTKVFLAAVTSQESVRRQIEDAFLTSLKPLGVEVLPSYNAITAAGEADKDKLTAAVKASGADAALVVRLVRRETRTTVSTGYPYGPTDFYGSYHSAWVSYYEPPLVYQYEVVFLEARLFDVKTEKLVWAVSTETEDCDKIQKEIAAYAKLLVKGLQKNGFVGAKP